MSTPLRVAAFVAALVAVFGLAVGVGRAVGPVDTEPAAHAGEEAHADDEAAGADGHAAEGSHDEEDGPYAVGLTTRAAGLTLALAERTVAPGRDVRLAFRVETSGGRPLLDYDVDHEKELHLVVVRRDLTGFQHLHPTLDRATGTWSTRADLTPGTWRVVADLVPAGEEGVVLADDLSVPGDFRPDAERRERRTDRVGDYELTLAGDTVPGAETVLTARVSRDGAPVDDLQPHLGAHGHLVVLREGDLGFLHVHPEGGGSGPGGPEVAFATTFPTAGTYRLFLDFRHDGVVRTADFTVHAEDDDDH
ncbi:hypothetical protein [Nocardioides solisilvae]|uniref:hypothetical protein n=1 Tax=Nocardioides solisilvae TaxID=1542435 RepID=UPI000D74231D|nr:hypothetical protein [Nocardioides solisilvae]